MPSSDTETAAKKSLVMAASACQCPRCRDGAIYKPGFMSLALNEKCPVCGLPLAKNDNGDGPAVFLIFVLGFSLVPLALLTDHFLHPPLWAIGGGFGVVALGTTIGALRPLKAYVMALQYKHRPDSW
jgi:uncharacterized protein (DUF983 family)